MNLLRAALLSAALTTSVPADDGKSMEAYSRIFRHRDGTRTESFKNGNQNEIEEFTYTKNNILLCKRKFITDTKGRTRMGYILDAKLNPLGTIQFGYDPTTDQLMEERQFNRKGQLVRRLFYPGALKDPRAANRFVALNYDPDNPNAKPVEAKEAVKPTRPVENDQDEFEAGIPIARGASAVASSSSPSAASQTPAAPRQVAPRSYFGGNSARKVPPQAPAALPVPAPAPAQPTPVPVPSPGRTEPAAAPETPPPARTVPARRPRT